MTARIDTSEWGLTAYAASGQPLAHAAVKDRALLEAYISECVDRTQAPAPAPAPEPSTGLPLTEVTYTTRARSTGATTSAGKTATGFGAQCLNHGSLVVAKNRTLAETLVSKPQEWCPSCAEIAAGSQPKIAKRLEGTNLL